MSNQVEIRTEHYYERLSLSQRVQHVIMMISFFLLALTGLPLRYPESPTSSWMITLVGGFTMRTVFHRVAAVVLIGISLYHIGWTIFTPRGRAELKAFIPKLKDGFDALHMMLFYFGLKPDAPKFDRFNFIEKFEYLAFGWGTAVMVGTGFMLWFEDHALMLLPKWTLDVAKIVHSYEALLAFLAIVVWHFYHVHLNPAVFPMSKIWLDGKISEHEMMEHHPLEYEHITGKRLQWVDVIKPEKQPERVTAGDETREE